MYKVTWFESILNGFQSHEFVSFEEAQDYARSTLWAVKLEDENGKEYKW